MMNDPMPGGSLKTIEELEPFDCRYPVAVEASEGRQLFCAEPCIEGKPYCQFHMKLAYRPRSKRLSREDRELKKAALSAAARNSREKV